ncbi:hypothetical protein NL108_018347 [Boleophthalmus pectinirostris]|nr:hypothetical protein NL108_018347 [Boleophthalmus pectinirostris]
MPRQQAKQPHGESDTDKSRANANGQQINHLPSSQPAGSHNNNVPHNKMPPKLPFNIVFNMSYSSFRSFSILAILDEFEGQRFCVIFTAFSYFSVGRVTFKTYSLTESRLQIT